jgi:hypothetical protein
MCVNLPTMNADKPASVIYDVCVVGAGPAGIIFALDYARLNQHHKILLVEYGGKNAPATNSLDESIKIVYPEYHHSPYECTNKGLGGTSATWGGRCVMWDEVDFIDRPLLNGGCTWNIDIFNEIQSYLPATADWFECGRPVFNLNNFSGVRKKRIAEHFTEGVVTDSALERWSMPTRFGERYAKDIADSLNITLLEGFEARDFSKPDAEGKVRFLTLREARSKAIFSIEAGCFVIAAGGQESTRILLRNTQLFSNLPAVPSALGKYYQGHLSGKIASVKFNGKPFNTDYGFIKDEDGSYARRRFQFSTDYLVSNNQLNMALWLDNPLYHNPGHKNGAMSFMYLAMITPVLGKKLAPPAIAHSITKGKKHSIARHILNVVKGLPVSLTVPAEIFIKRYLPRRKLPGVFLYNSQNYYALHFHSEQIPDENNCMKLAEDGETLIIKYAPAQGDVDSVIKLHDVLDAWLQQCGCGKLEYWYPREKLAEAIMRMSKDGVHQSGTTRIADTPEAGVVNRNLGLWGCKNVFVCSSAVFPTSGQANPTFLLGAFALRLSKYLTETMPHKMN